jgi:hypothetical protein
MESNSPGDLVSVAVGGAVIDGIVFDNPSRAKVVVAVLQEGRGPVFRTVHPDALSERDKDGPSDAALRLLMKRTSPPVRGVDIGRGGGGARRAGHARGSMHRTTGK